MSTRQRINNIAGKFSRHPLFSNTANILSLLGVVIAVVYGWIGWRANVRMEDLSKEQIRIAKEQGNAAIRVDKFSELLSQNSALLVKATNQVDKLIELNKTLSREVQIIESQWQMNVEIRKEENKVNTRKAVDRKNQLIFILNEITYVLYDYHLVKQKNEHILCYSVQERYDKVTKIKDIMQGFGYAREVLGDTAVFNKWLKTNNSVIESRGAYLLMLKRGELEDKTDLGQRTFESIIYGIIENVHFIGQYLSDESKKNAARK